MKIWTVGFVLLAIVAAACSGVDSGGGSAATEIPEATNAPASTDPPTTTAPSVGADPAAATSCEELADSFIAINQELIAVFGKGPIEDFWIPGDESYPPEVDAAGRAWRGKMTILSAQDQILGCSEVLEQLVCDERASQLEVPGDAALAFLYDNFPCELEDILGTDAAAEAEARLDEWQTSQVDG